jgi:hypothetical protein
MDGDEIGAASGTKTTLAALHRRRRICDIVGFVSLLIGGSWLMWSVLGQGQAWPIVVAAVCLAIGSIAMVIRSRLTKRIWLLDPPTEPLYKRAWPDGT